jgi:hypothetical protein
MRPARTLVLLAAAALAACGSVQPSAPDARPGDDGGAIDAPDVTMIDGGVDAAVDAGIDAAPPPPGQELTTGGGRVTGPVFTLDVQLGHPIDQGELRGASFRLSPNTPIKP